MMNQQKILQGVLSTKNGFFNQENMMNLILLLEAKKFMKLT